MILGRQSSILIVLFPIAYYIEAFQHFCYSVCFLEPLEIALAKDSASYPSCRMSGCGNTTGGNNPSNSVDSSKSN